MKRNSKNKKGTKGQTRRIENKKQKERKEEEGGISLPGRGPRQTLEAWLRVSGEDDVLGRSKDPVAEDHLQIKRKLGGYFEESLGVRVGQFLVDDHKRV